MKLQWIALQNASVPQPSPSSAPTSPQPSLEMASDKPALHTDVTIQDATSSPQTIAPPPPPKPPHGWDVRGSEARARRSIRN